MDVTEEEPEEEWEEFRRGTRKKEDLEEDLEKEQEEEIRRGLSNKRYVYSCIIEDSSLTFYWLFIYC